MNGTIKVKSVEGHMVQNYEAMRAGLKRFVGYTYFAKEIDGKVRNGWEKTDEVVSLPCRKEYLDALRDGALEPADENTAVLAGRPAQPSPKSKAKE